MTRRPKVGGKPIKGRLPNAQKPRRSKMTKATPRSMSSSSRDQTEVTRLTCELNAAIERQNATAEILASVSRSSTDTRPVFDAILDNLLRLFRTRFALVLLVRNGMFEVGGIKGDLSFDELAKHYPLPVDERLLPGKAVLAGRPMQLSPIVGNVEAPSNTQRMAIEFGFNAQISVPLIRDGEAIGALSAARRDAIAFTDEQVALIKSFAAQAVIAIENARLLSELRERTADLSDALEQQTATSDVLKIVSSSPGELQPVFDAMLANATRLCGASYGTMWLQEDEGQMRMAARHGPLPKAFSEKWRIGTLFRPSPSVPTARVFNAQQPVQVRDLKEDRAYADRDPLAVASVDVAGIRSLVAVPMIKDGATVGAITVYRQEVRPFTDKQIELVKNFAAQAVIAIENARLLNELRQRTDDLSETLEQQTASAKVLEVISRSAFDLHAVFETVAESSVRLCEADRAFIFQYDGELLRMKAFYNASPELADWVREHPVRPGNHLASARAALHRQTIHIPDVQVDPDYFHGGKLVEAFRTVLTVPILKSDDLLGVIMIYRLDVQPFTEKQIALVETFADQAAIAIENTRLLQELRERTDEVVNLNQELEQRVADQVGEIERMSRLRRFLPPQVADLIVASGTEKQLESHRREITALFCDLRGFTGFTESADAEDVMALLRDYHAAIGEIIIRYNGTLERYAGDGVMVVFNDPVPVENPALQAVLMALELRNALGALTQTWSRLGHEIGFGIGIAHGFATLGTIGYEGRFDYAAIGTVSNVASRLCDEAKPGQILISPRVLTKVEDAVKVEPVGEFELKGIRRPLAAYNVVAIQSSDA